MYNSIKSVHPWQTSRTRVKGSERRSFILVLDWMMVNVTLIMRMNLSPGMTDMTDMIPVLEVTLMVPSFPEDS